MKEPAVPNVKLTNRKQNSFKDSLKHFIRSRPPLHSTVLFVLRIGSSLRLPNVYKIARGYVNYFIDLFHYRRLPGAEKIRMLDLYPCVLDKTASTPLDLNYFLQDTWAAKKVFSDHPEFHVDVGSTAILVGILSKFTRICSVDIRPLPVEMEGLESRTGSILSLPFPDRTLKSISSLCVIEHIGLGRYGDPLDPSGTDRAAKELQRVLAVGGNLYVSVPIDPVGRVFFNAHRSFTFNSFVEKFSQLDLADISLIQNGQTFALSEIHTIPYSNGMVVGLFHFKRKNR
jgi:SAM-dependent methyltransferase